MNLITYEDKVALNDNTEIPNKNKITMNDMNELKKAINNGVVRRNLQKIDDANLNIETGYYYTDGTTTNLPFDGSAGYLICLHKDATTHMQFWIRYRDNQIWMRQYNLRTGIDTVASWKAWEQIKPNVEILYSNSTGSTSSVTLSENASNYNSIMIELTPKQYKNFLGVKHIAIVPKNGNFSDSTSWYNNENARMYTLLFNYTISNNKITITLNQGGSVGTDTAYGGEKNVFAITKVIGFGKK